MTINNAEVDSINAEITLLAMGMIYEAKIEKAPLAVRMNIYSSIIAGWKEVIDYVSVLNGFGKMPDRIAAKRMVDESAMKWHDSGYSSEATKKFMEECREVAKIFAREHAKL